MTTVSIIDPSLACSTTWKRQRAAIFHILCINAHDLLKIQRLNTPLQYDGSQDTSKGRETRAQSSYHKKTSVLKCLLIRTLLGIGTRRRQPLTEIQLGHDTDVLSDMMAARLFGNRNYKMKLH